jgi:predicted aspartyl protease
MLKNNYLLKTTLSLFLVLYASVAAGENIIPSSQCRGLFIVPVSWKDKTLELILDTGAKNTSIDPDAIERISGKRIRTGKKVTLRNGHAGPLHLKKIKADTHEMDHLSLALGHPVDGILGFNVFHDLLLTLDYPAAEVRVETGSLPEVDNVEIFSDIGRSRPFIRVNLGEKTVPVLIDSGFSGGIDFNLDDPLAWETAPKPVSAVARYSEIVIQRAGRVSNNLVFGPLTLERPVARASRGTRLAGAELLSRFILIFDHENGRISMQPDNPEPVTFESYRGQGMAFRPRRTGMEVIDVFAGTPAEKAGIQKKDMLLSINGTPVHERGCKSVNQQSELEPVVMTMERDGKVFDVEIESAVLIP